MKNIVICSDGTGNEYGANNTNVVKLYQRVLRTHLRLPFTTRAWAHSASWGGTRSSSRYRLGNGIWRRLAAKCGRCLQVSQDRYESGDRCFCSDSVAERLRPGHSLGMLHKCGLLQKGSNTLIPYASRCTTGTITMRSPADSRRLTRTSASRIL